MVCDVRTTARRNRRLSSQTRSQLTAFGLAQFRYRKYLQREAQQKIQRKAELAREQARLREQEAMRQQQVLGRREQEKQLEIQRQREIDESRRKAEEEPRREERNRRQREEQVRRQKLTNYWASLDPLKFEDELGGIYRQLGYSVRLTPKSGDHGVDLILSKDEKTTVVQCKQQKSPAGERVVRELLGSMVAAKADRAVFACTGGFTQPAKDFARSLPVDLMDVHQLVGLVEQAIRRSQPEDPKAGLLLNGIPICPMRGSGSEMVLRDGKYGRFWGCPKYSDCTGTRQAPINP